MEKDILEYSGVYKITNIVNGKIYIGSAVKFKERFRIHKQGLRNNKHANRHLQGAWNIDGEGAFSFEVILVCDKKDTLFYEQLIMDAYKSYNDKIGYNICPKAGSNLGRKSTEETKEKIRKVKTGVIPSKESRKKLSETLLNLPNREEVNEKISNKLRGKPKPDGFGDKIRNRVISKETLEKRGKAIKEAWARRKENKEEFEAFKIQQRNNQLGKKPSEETREKLVQASKKMWEDRIADEDKYNEYISRQSAAQCVRVINESSEEKEIRAKSLEKAWAANRKRSKN